MVHKYVRKHYNDTHAFGDVSLPKYDFSRLEALDVSEKFLQLSPEGILFFFLPLSQIQCQAHHTGCPTSIPMDSTNQIPGGTVLACKPLYGQRAVPVLFLNGLGFLVGELTSAEQIIRFLSESR